MDRVNALAPRQLLLGAGVLMLVFTFLPWQSIDLSIVSASRNAWHGFWGVVMCLMLVALLALVAAKTFGVALPPVIPFGLTTLALGVGILVFAVLKNLTDDFSAWASYVGIVIAAVVALGAWRVFGETGEKLPESFKPATPSGDA